MTAFTTTLRQLFLCLFFVACSASQHINGDSPLPSNGAAADGAANTGDSAPPSPTLPAQAEIATPTATFSTAAGEVKIALEVVSTPHDRARGLMHRRELPAYSGMLFVFPRLMVQTFWMKNTYLSLDLIFIDDDLQVVGIVANAEPLNEKTLSVDAPSRFVVEVNGGFAAANGIQAGSKVYFSPEPPTAQR